MDITSFLIIYSNSDLYDERPCAYGRFLCLFFDIFNVILPRFVFCVV